MAQAWRQRGRRGVWSAAECAELLQQGHTGWATAGEQRGAVRRGGREPLGMKRGRRLAQGNTEPRADLPNGAGRIGGHLAHLPHQHSRGMPTGEVAQQPVDVHPHLDGQRRIRFEHRIAPAVEGIDHVPRLAKQKQVAGVGNDRIPEVEQQRGPRILPAPGFPQRPAGCDEWLRLVAKGRPGLDPNPAHEAVIGEAVGPQQVAVELVELEILEVPQRITGMRGEHSRAEIQPRVVEERGRE